MSVIKATNKKHAKFPRWLSGEKNPPTNARICKFSPWVGKIPWGKIPTHSVFLPCEIPWTERPDGLQVRGFAKELDTTHD